VAGFVRERTGSLNPGIAPSNIYPTSCGRSVLIGANQDTVFRRLCQVMGQEALGTDPRFASHTARGQNQALLDRLIGEWTVQHTRESVLVMLDEAGIPAGQLYTAKEMLDDPQFASRNTIIRAPSDDLGQVAMQNVAPKLSETPGSVHHAGVKLGAFNREIFVGRLGLSEEQFAAYQKAGVI
jgi:crotonobetainyl-CoA:carnitine CoA-transferase CaiB-like acyl-CoA transferase